MSNYLDIITLVGFDCWDLNDLKLLGTTTIAHLQFIIGQLDPVTVAGFDLKDIYFTKKNINLIFLRNIVGVLK